MTKRSLLYTFFFSTGLVIALLFFSRVDNKITKKDIQYLKKIIPRDLKQTVMNFDSEIFIIKQIQKGILDQTRESYTTTQETGIPKFQSREPKDLFFAQQSLCYDRSRSIEKALRITGFKVRHLFLIEQNENTWLLKSLLSKTVTTHAVTEVLTSKGWMIVDSNHKWISLDKKKNPISIQDLIHAQKNDLTISWATPPKPGTIYTNNIFVIYGLYSRHGKFYPPYNFVPDIHYGEFLYNFF